MTSLASRSAPDAIKIHATENESEAQDHSNGIHPQSFSAALTLWPAKPGAVAAVHPFVVLPEVVQYIRQRLALRPRYAPCSRFFEYPQISGRENFKIRRADKNFLGRENIREFLQPGGRSHQRALLVRRCAYG